MSEISPSCGCVGIRLLCTQTKQLTPASKQQQQQQQRRCIIITKHRLLRNSTNLRAIIDDVRAFGVDDVGLKEAERRRALDENRAVDAVDAVLALGKVLRAGHVDVDAHAAVPGRAVEAVRRVHLAPNGVVGTRNRLAVGVVAVALPVRLAVATAFHNIRLHLRDNKRFNKKNREMTKKIACVQEISH
jgi:hypothetical protein